MTEAEWLACNDPARMIDHLGWRLTERQARHFAVACCRLVWQEFRDERVRRIVEVADRFARGQATRKERLAAEVEAYHIYADTTPHGAYALSHGVIPTPEPFPDIAAALAVSERPGLAYLFAFESELRLAATRAEQAQILRDVVAWPGRPIIIRSSWLTPSVRELAQAVEHDDDFGRLPILGDALEEAGCEDRRILQHCRAENRHVPGCWLVRELCEAMAR